MKRLFHLTLILLLGACEPTADPSQTGADAGGAVHSALNFHLVGNLTESELDEASGIQALAADRFLVHNDEGRALYVVDETGVDLGRIRIDGAKHKDWEDMALVPAADGRLVVIGDIGDNDARRKKVWLYFVQEPEPDSGGKGYPSETEVMHRLELRYEDGPRDVESMAYDPHSGMLLFLSKRDQPPRLYGVPLADALSSESLTAAFLAEVPGLRPPTRRDILSSPKRGLWVSQPTAMDISPDGRLAAVLTYRSLYLFQREEGESWSEAFQRQPEEFIGPPGLHDEAVAFSPDQAYIYVTTEHRPAPLYRMDL
jgi:hypothetical protein